MSRRRGRAICAGIRAGVSIVPPSPRPREKWRRTVRKRLGRWLTVGILVVGILVGTVVLALSETTYKDPCAADRDLFAFSLTSDGTSYSSISEAVSIVASENGYGELSTSERETIEKASEAAASAAPTAATIAVEPDLPDSDVAADLVVTLDRTEDGKYIPSGGSYCAKVVGG